MLPQCFAFDLLCPPPGKPPAPLLLQEPLSAPHVAPWPVPAIVEVGKFRDEHSIILPSHWTPTHSWPPGKSRELRAWAEPCPARGPALRPAPGKERRDARQSRSGPTHSDVGTVCEGGEEAR